jgi:hypothetical protein
VDRSWWTVDSGQFAVGSGQYTVGIRQWVGGEQWALFCGEPYFEAIDFKINMQTEANNLSFYFEVNILKQKNTN